jgi:ABC-type Fe3+/spermidine/putrescine transport system ATPase subunit
VRSQKAQDPIVRVEDLTKRYPKRGTKAAVTAVDGVSFSVRRGEVTGLLGPNGAGKTTTIKTICGLLRPDAGRVVVNGVDNQRHRLRALRHISAVLEGNRNLYWRLTVRENLFYFAGNRGVSVRTVRPTVERLLAQFRWEITLEATRGTLEQLYMSPLGAWRILLARMIGTVLVNLLIIVLMVTLAMLTARQWLNLDLVTLLPVLLLTITGMLGVGFMVVGLALVYKQVESLLQIVQFVFLALVAVPLSAAPWLEFAPVVKGADMVRAVMVEGVSLGGFGLFDWFSLTGSAVVYFALGVGF